MPDGSGRFLKGRMGHAAPLTKITFHGSNGENILSSGLDSSVRRFSTVKDSLNRSLGQASHNRRAAKRKGVKYDVAKLPPIMNFASESAREKDWDSIAACHRNLNVVTTWNYDRCCMGKHKLLHDRFKGQRNVVPLCLTISICGNFVIIGYNTGHVDKFNIQSGIYRGSYGEYTAHEGQIRGVVTDGLNQLTVTGGSDCKLKFWKFKDRTQLATLDVQDQVSQMLLHRESGMLAVALDTFVILIIDVVRRNVVRTFSGHRNRITDMTFSPDSFWLIVSSMDATIRTWDLSSGSLLDCFCVSSPCTSLAMSPTGEYLATVHIDDLGIYLWANYTLYSPVILQPLANDYEPLLLKLPTISLEDTPRTNNDEELEESSDEEIDMNVEEYVSPEQIAEHLVTLSLLPRSRWCNLLNLNYIKQRNKPKEPPSAPKNAPFFLPVVSGLEPKFVVEEKTSEENKEQDSKIRTAKLQSLSKFGEMVLIAVKKEEYLKVIEEMMKMSTSSIDLEIRSLAPLGGGSIDLLLNFMKAINESLKSKRNFEFIESVLSLFIKVHEKILIAEPILLEYAEILSHTSVQVCCDLQKKINYSLCILNFLRYGIKTN
ncbi:WD repeat-containing protein 36-like [Centruroides sculpturatus]|uniref:WD repeat-containing protein 36-like n=1 Tax=Centruroides sculpturatus TaxID=218467 RepID=UPI000C6DA894|nr:WD repeat-containing protein 36-like [Centruroides sculpturatus]